MGKKQDPLLQLRAPSLIPLLLTSLVVFSQVGGGEGDKLEDELKQQYKGHVLELRSCYVGSSLKFDAQGSLLNPAQLGGCAANQSLQVEALKLGDASMKLHGRRLITFFDLRGNGKGIISGNSFDIDIEMGSGAHNQVAIQQALLKVFRTNQEPPIRPPLTPEQYRSTRFDIQPGKALLVRFKGTSEWRAPEEIDEPINVGELDDGQKIYIGSKAVKAPRPLHVPNPEFTNEARGKWQEGTVEMQVVIDSRGRVHAIRLTRILGAGLDEAAVKAVSSWTFTPASLEGKSPVAVAVRVEVNFRLYK